MTLDYGLDAQLPISREGVLAALDTAIKQAVSFRRLTLDAQTDLSVTEIDAHIEYLRLLHENIKEDRCNNYAPVVRKRFGNDRSLI